MGTESTPLDPKVSRGTNLYRVVAAASDAKAKASLVALKDDSVFLLQHLELRPRVSADLHAHMRTSSLEDCDGLFVRHFLQATAIDYGDGGCDAVENLSLGVKDEGAIADQSKK